MFTTSARVSHARRAVATPQRMFCSVRVRIVIDSDAHRTRTLQNMRWGVATARRAWLTRADVVNTRTWRQLQRFRKQARQ